METAKCNSIRVPIGHFTLGPQFCHKTAFDGEPAQVYVNAWGAVKKVIKDCYDRGIGVLLDLHALPGGANKDAHSGTNSGKAELWNSEYHLRLAKECVRFVMQEVVSLQLPNVIGIELCNEPSRAASRAVFKWYDDVLNMTSAIEPSLPIYIGDCWDLPTAIKYAMQKNSLENAPRTRSNPIIVDTHKYYTFAAIDHSQTPHQIIDRVKSSLGDVAKNQGNVFTSKTAVSVYIGEYSCTMDVKTWNKVDSADRPVLTQAFGRAQSEKWHQTTCGSAFWTLKMNWMDGGDWGFKKQVKTGAVIPPPNLILSLEEVITRYQEANARKEQLRAGALSQHVNYWDKKMSSTKSEHWRYENGWNIGFRDAMDFFCARINDSIPCSGQAAGADRIGALEMWIRKRMIETGQLSSPMGWEWEHGYRTAVKDFEKATQI